jgi:hypothetical protein
MNGAKLGLDKQTSAIAYPDFISGGLKTLNSVERN